MIGKVVAMDDDDFRVNFVPPGLDLRSGSSTSLEPRSESTRSNSLETGITVESSRCFSSESCGDAETRPDECSGWTNEKHNSYIDSLEKSFVRQLYCLMGRRNQRSFGTHHLPTTNSCKSIDQFAVLRDGCWQKIKFGNKRTRLDATSNIYFHENPWTSHFPGPSGSYDGETAVRGDLYCNEETNHSGSKAFSGTPLRNPVGHEGWTGIAAEASGQNFADESKEEKPSSHSPVCKRRRRDPEPNCSENDQVVPLGTAKPKGVSSGKQYEWI
ncbi:PREDICTED: uncharacterized protein LOC104819577 [Tarenaya hassleriana]|uniref:uncharacterized protein LOC104819577 n=1 Tax=Tarenaya hassleriana TaxID=28532 RepID=UPI00053C9B22|nr:PREDICTED: uncharacterized protein LOC104819577 [Tarenaya hassleriana]